jgi:hypothetical protein
MIPLDPYASLIKWGAVAAIAIGVWFHGYSKGNDSGEVAVAKLEAKHAKAILGWEQEAREYEQAIRLKERQVADDIAAIATAYEDQKNEAVKKARDSVLADVRSGRIRLRAFTSQAGSGTNATPAAACQCDGEAASGSQDADSLVGRVAESIAIAAEADAQLSACQSTAVTYYQATKGPK